MTHRTILLALAAAITALAQPTIAPTNEPIGTARGRSQGDYNITSSFETGVRGVSTDGNEIRYRSDVNYRSGFRLFGGSFTAHSKEGKGKLFDELVIHTQGLGNDPYETASARLQHNTWYRYELLWRRNDYFNPGLTGGLAPAHAMNTQRNWQDHDFTFLPQSKFRFLAGYSRNSQDGPALSSVQLFDSRGDEFPLFSDIQRRQTEFRVGAQGEAGPLKIVLLHGHQRFEESTVESATSHPGVNTTDRTALTSLRRSEPYEGDSPFWRLNLFSTKQAKWSVNGRLSYSAGRRTFAFDESAAGVDRLGANRARQILVAGAGVRPVTSAGLTVSLFPNQKVTVANHTSFHQVQMGGDAAYREIANANALATVVHFNYLGIRTFANATDVNVRVNRRAGLYGGLRLSHRDISSREGEILDGQAEAVRGEQNNRMVSVLGGVRLQLAKPVTLSVDTEVGRENQPFLPVSPKNYHAAGGRLQYKTKSLQLSASSRANYNTNSSSLFTHSARARVHSFDASYSARGGLRFDAGYSKLHLNTATGIAYFAAFQQVDGDRSLYVSNLHTVHSSVHYELAKRASLTFTLSRVQDTGDGRARPEAAVGAALAYLAAAQTYPLSYVSPAGRISVRLHQKARLNFGYQYYGLGEEFSSLSNYRAHTVFSSLLWTF